MLKEEKYLKRLTIIMTILPFVLIANAIVLAWAD